MKKRIRPRDLAQLEHSAESCRFALMILGGARRLCSDALGITQANVQPGEVDALEDMLHGDLTVRQLLKKYAITVADDPTPKTRRKKNAVR